MFCAISNSTRLNFESIGRCVHIHIFTWDWIEKRTLFFFPLRISRRVLWILYIFTKIYRLRVYFFLYYKVLHQQIVRVMQKTVLHKMASLLTQSKRSMTEFDGCNYHESSTCLFAYIYIHTHKLYLLKKENTKNILLRDLLIITLHRYLTWQVHPVLKRKLKIVIIIIV